MENFCENICPCDRSFAPTASYTNLSWFEFAQLVAGTKRFFTQTSKVTQSKIVRRMQLGPDFGQFVQETCHSDLSPSVSLPLSFNLVLFFAYQPTCHAWLVNMPLPKVLVTTSCQDNELYYSFPLG